jgi:alpha-N-arabinofuranosidase
MNRRQFALGAAAGLLAPRSVSAAEVEISVLPQEKIGVISPMIHGHFVEHLGGVVYDGIWVGEGSKIPNVDGLRKSLVDDLRAINAPVFRWPGGCFADSYNWRDGVGPRAERPVRTNFWADNGFLAKQTGGPAKFDPNTFGTNEFARFCQLAGGKPYFAVNLRSGTAREFYEWVEYCNSPAGSTTLARLRGGEPFNVEYWGIGNESWGCGGNFTGSEYSVEYRKFLGWVPRYGVPLKYIAAGPSSGDLAWSRGFFEGMLRKGPRSLRSVWGFALHHYCGTEGEAVKFSNDDWYKHLKRAYDMDKLIHDHWTVMGEFDREHAVKLLVDEWGAWHRPGSQIAQHHLLGQQSTMRDAVIAGMTLDVFNRHAEKIVMANIAQLINCLQSLFLAHEDQYVKTVNYHVFAMHRAHQNGESVRCVFSSPSAPFGSPGVTGSASIKGKTLTVTCTNPHHDRGLETGLSVAGSTVSSVEAKVLAASSLMAHNTFKTPNAVVPVNLAAAASGGGVRLTLPAASVVAMTIQLS